MEWSQELWLLIKYLLLGLFQGFTEPIPVSSSGHLVLLQHFLGVEIEGLSFEVMVNFASLFAVIVIYRFDLLKLVKGSARYVLYQDAQGKGDFRISFYLLLATVPAVLAALLFKDWIETELKQLHVIAFALLITGMALWLIRHLNGRKQDGDITLKDALLVGLAQTAALIPGISRSGATIVAAMGLGWRQETALRFSFFLYIPISLGSGVLAISDIVQDPHFTALWIPYTIAFIGSFIASYVSLLWFMNIMRHGKLIYFALYCWLAGLIVLSLLS
ncbi:undecaprenyl-diphosphate phosphatase [Halalkalibacterium halodurans]|uniref:undecaprenyl-diphosphate phosphatase n=1 Tax=Halalkalibacterium halodurans TaxID=86665 RepID=UPI002E24A898|nr:undecaprenyl-diphosphate phosphatase [Halalkalibacterium halodurans]